MYRSLIKPALFRMSAEGAHDFAVKMIRSGALSWLPGRLCLSAEQERYLATDLCGIPLTHPIGLAAGFDKNGTMYPQLHHLGFAFVEVGTVTAQAQSGNPKPRLFRLPADQAIVNRMGFNNDGAAAVAARLAERSAAIPLGGNIGKSKVTALTDAGKDYETSFRLFHPHVDYFVVNVSSPNTPGLRELQAKEPLTRLLLRLQSLNRGPMKPMLLKIAPDLTESELVDIVAVAEHVGIAGIIATNTTIRREPLITPTAEVARVGAGGLSGRPLTSLATEKIRFLRRHLSPEIHIVGVGGISTGRDAYEKILAGASCLQLYTGLVYHGPRMVNTVVKDLYRLLKEAGFPNLKAAVGTAVEAG